MTCVENVIDEQLHDLDPARVRARRRLQTTLCEQSLFDPIRFDGQTFLIRRR
jgi:hypothetical protein